jgi:PmbA protein
LDRGDNRLLTDDVVNRARSMGIDEFETTIAKRKKIVVKGRIEKIVGIESTVTQTLGIRVYRQGKFASSSTTDLSEKSIERLLKNCSNDVSVSEVDSANSLPDADLIGIAENELNLYDPKIAEPDLDYMKRSVLDAEKAAFDHDSRIINSEESVFVSACSEIYFANSLGFHSGYRSTKATLYTRPVAEDEESGNKLKGKKQGDYWFSSARHLADLMPPKEIGREAARRTLLKIGSRQPKTEIVPVVFDPITASEMLGNILEAVTGTLVYRDASILTDKIGSKIANEKITIYDDPLIKAALGSRPFDGEGVRPKKLLVIDKGKLINFLHNSFTAAKCGAKSTGHAGISLKGRTPVTCSNFCLKPSEVSPGDIIAEVKNGVYVTSFSGRGFDTTSGLFSQGASGFRISNGKLAYPLSGFTLAGNILDIIRNITAIGNDPPDSIIPSSPTLKVEAMQLAGVGQ